MSLIKRLWTAKAKPIEIQANGDVYSIAFSPDARYVVGGGQSKTIGQWQVEDGRGMGLEPIDVARYSLNIAISKDGRLVAYGGSSGLAEVWDIETRTKVVTAEPLGTWRVFGVDLSPDSTRFATGAGRDVAVWSIPTGRQLLGPLEHADFVAAVKFSPSGDRIATATWEQNSIRLYDSSNGQLLIDIPDRVSSPYNTSLVWSNDGRQLFIASYAGKIKCFHVSGSFLSWMEWDVRANNQPVSIALASNGKFIASASSRFVSFWDTSTHKRIGPIIEHTERVWSIALSSDGHLASGGDDQKIILRNLRNILPRSYFLDSGDRSRTLPQNPIVQESSSLAEVRRLQALLAERDVAIEESRKERDKLEQTMQSLSATLRAQEENMDKLKQEISDFKKTVRGLRKQLSDAQGTAQTLTKRLDQRSEAAYQHKLEAERVKAAFDELKVKHETDLAQAQKPVLADPETGYRSRHRVIGINVFESWMRDNPGTANTLGSEDTEDDSIMDYNALACSAFVQARSQNWTAAHEDAQKSVNTQPSAIGHIAKAVALVGLRDHKAAMRAFALVFRDGDPNENEFMLVIWAVLSCLGGEYIDGILRVHDLVGVTDADMTTRSSVQAYMYVLLGNRYMKEGDYERATQLFDHARTSSSPHTTPRLEIISLISGWQFDGLELMARQYLREALHAGRAKDVTESPIEGNT